MTQKDHINTIIDISIVESRKNLDPSFWEMIKDLFFAETPPLIEEIQGKLINKELNELSVLSHKLKGMSANLGAIKLQETSYLLEQQAKKNQPQGLEELFNQLKEDFNHSITELKKL